MSMREWEDRHPTKDCPACGLAVLVEAETCRWCHHDLAEPVAKPSGAVVIVIAVVLLIWGFVLSL
jgi:uncharacterized protein (DUF983 family)